MNRTENFIKIILLLCIAVLITVFSFNADLENTKGFSSEPSLSVKPENKNIRFDFSAQRTDRLYEQVEVHASLFNDGADTVYFLSSSCEGEQYSLRYDTAVFKSAPVLLCNASYPRVFKILPHSHYDFRARFLCSNSVQKMKLGFDFYSVIKSFDINKVSLSDIHSRPVQEQQIIWGDEKIIQ